MAMAQDVAVRRRGTRFRIFPQPHYLRGFEAPETIWVSVPPGAVGPGPADHQLVTVDAIDKRPYRAPYGPPHAGERHPPVHPDAQGHFDHLVVGTRAFKVAQMYASARRVLDIWEGYFGRPIQWHFAPHFARMELVPLLHWDNAHSGYGFLEAGFARDPWGGLDPEKPYCLNFDVIAHELGHSIVNAEVALPLRDNWRAEYRAFHESASDLVALIAVLHFERVVDRLLERTAGCLFGHHVLGRIGELCHSREIRNAFNLETLSSVASHPHALSQPLTGAVFDVLVEGFEAELVRQGLISQALAALSCHPPDDAVSEAWVEAGFREAYRGNPGAFKRALLDARDDLGALLAGAWSTLDADDLTYQAVGRALLSVDARAFGGRHQAAIRASFGWRGIELTPADGLRANLATSAWPTPSVAPAGLDNR